MHACFEPQLSKSCAARAPVRTSTVDFIDLGSTNIIFDPVGSVEKNARKGMRARNKNAPKNYHRVGSAEPKTLAKGWEFKRKSARTDFLLEP